MKNLNLYIIAIFTIFITVFLNLIIYVSLLGDNHKINYAVEQYFADIKNRTFTTPCQMKMPLNTEEAISCRDNCFLLETALLEHFDLLKAEDYAVEIERGHFWIPFITDDTVSVGIAFTRKKDSFFKEFTGKKEIVYIDNLIIIKKENKLWRIQKIDIEATQLAPAYNKLKKEIDLNKYIYKTEDGYNINKAEIDFENLSPLARRLFEYNVDKLSHVDGE